MVRGILFRICFDPSLCSLSLFYLSELSLTLCMYSHTTCTCLRVRTYLTSVRRCTRVIWNPRTIAGLLLALSSASSVSPCVSRVKRFKEVFFSEWVFLDPGFLSTTYVLFGLCALFILLAPSVLRSPPFMRTPQLRETCRYHVRYAWSSDTDCCVSIR